MNVQFQRQLLRGFYFYLKNEIKSGRTGSLSEQDHCQQKQHESTKSFVRRKKGLQFCEIMADNLCGSTSKECATCHKKDLLVRKTMAFSPAIFDTTGIG